jgi:hypothetical protein
MVRTSVGALLGTLLLVGAALAADKEVTGKVVKVDAAGKTITVQTAQGKVEYTVASATKLLDAKGGTLRDGLKALTPGTEVTLLVPMTGSTIKELKLGGPDKTPKKDAPTKEVKGTPAKVLKVDADKRTATVETETGRKMELKLGEDVKFVGPRGGVSKEGIKDDRFVAGAEIRVVLDSGGKNVTEIHLPFRKSDKDKDGKDKEKDKKKDK